MRCPAIVERDEQLSKLRSLAVAAADGSGSWVNVVGEGGVGKTRLVSYRTDSGWTVLDVWEDEATFAAFGDVIGPATAAAGLDAKPVGHPLEGTIAQDGTRTTY